MIPTIFTVLILAICFSDVLMGDDKNKNITVLNIQVHDVKKLINIPENSTILIHVMEIPTNASALLFQAHSHSENITMSQKAKMSFHTAVSGRNIGMVIQLQSFESEAYMWLLNRNIQDISVLLVLSTLDLYGPVPGGCNMEFPIEVAPYLRLRTDVMVIYLEYQHARIGCNRNELPPNCKLSSSYITYETYVSFLKENDFGEEEYFNKIGYMSDMSAMKQHANKVQSYSVHPNTRFVFLRYPNVGAVYNVIAKYTVDGKIKETLYVPIATYGCDSLTFTEYGCRLSYTIEGKILLFALSIYGFLIACFGHFYTGPALFFFGFLASFFVVVILLGKYSVLVKKTIIQLTVLIALLGGAIFLILWWWLRNQLISLTLNGLVFGFLLTSTLFYTPVGNSEVLANTKNYWAMLTTGTLFITVLFLAFPTSMNIMGSSIVGSYIMLLFYDDFIGTRLAYIILNVIRRAISEKLDFASNDYPFQAKDIIISTAWVALSLLALIVQWKRELASRRSYASHRSSSHFSPDCTRNCSRQVSANQHFESARQPLLREDSRAHYQTFHQ